MNYLSNLFSLRMLGEDLDFSLIQVKRIEAKDIPNDAQSYITNSRIARVLSNILGRRVVCNTDILTMEKGDILYVAQYQGTPLEKRATQVAQGGRFSFMKVTIAPSQCSSCVHKEESVSRQEFRKCV